MSKRDYYQVLGVQRGASADQIKSAYRALARQLHPDVNKASDAAKRFAEVQEAYDALSDPKQRSLYDQFGHAGVSGGGASQARPNSRASHAWPGGGAVEIDPDDLGSMFEAFFGGRGEPRAARGRGQRAARPHHADPIEHPIRVPFVTMALGGTIPLRIEHAGRAQTIDVKVPAGIADGSKLRVRGVVTDELGAPRDAVLSVRVADHPLYRRATPDSLDLIAEIPVTLGEALFGGAARLRLLDGTIIEITIPAGSRGGQRLRVRDRGIDSGSSRGDLYAVLNVVPPDPASLNDAERTAIKAVSSRQANPRSGPDWPGAERQ